MVVSVEYMRVSDENRFLWIWIVCWTLT